MERIDREKRGKGSFFHNPARLQHERERGSKKSAKQLQDGADGGVGSVSRAGGATDKGGAKKISQKDSPICASRSCKKFPVGS